MPSQSHSNPMLNVQENQDTRPTELQDDVQFQMSKVTIKHPNKVRRFQNFFRKPQTKQHRLHTDGSPLDKTNVCTIPWYSWLTPIFYKSWKGTLAKEDLFSCSPYDGAQVNSDRIEDLWQKELEYRGPEKASLARVYYQFLAKRSLYSCVLSFIAIMSNFFSSAVLVRLLLEYCQQDTADLGYGLMLAGFMVLCQCCLVYFMGHSFYMNIRSAGRARAATVCMIYHKTVHLRSMKGLSIGEIVNLCANDGQRMFDMLMFLPHALAGPLLAVFALVYTVYLIGPAALLGTGVFIAFYPLQGLFSKIVAHYRRHAIAVTDHRVRLMSEIINSIKLIKMYAWEDSFAATIGDVRKKEQGWLEKSGFFQTLCQSFTTLVPGLSTILTVLLHTLLGHNITPAQAFSYFAVLTSIRFMIMATPMAIKSLTEAFVAFSRIKPLLLMDELKEFKDKPADPILALSLSGVTFAWDKEQSKGTSDTPKGITGDPLEKSQRGKEQGGRVGGQASERQETDLLVDQDATISKTLFDINLDVRKGQLLGICGSIGSGKSSLLQSILSRMILVDGKVAVDGSFAYVSQQACIMNMTLRENVLMGAEFDQEQYAKAIKVCALQDDMDLLPGGDQTEIGERGINISGGQKQRVSLARAVYSNKDIYLLDDPLSAVDAHVGNHIFSQCIDTVLKGKTILFVTHQLQFLKRCDRIVLMKDGRIMEDGTHRELMDNGNEYYNLIKMFHSEDNEEDIIYDTSDNSNASSDGIIILQDNSTPLANDIHGNPGSEGTLSVTSSDDIHQSVHSPEQACNHKDRVEDSTNDSSVSRIVITEVDDNNPGIVMKCHEGGRDYDKSSNVDDEIEDDRGHPLDALTSEDDKNTISAKEDDQFVGTELKFGLQLNYLRHLSADSGSLGGSVDSEETVFYNGKLMEEEEKGNRGITMGTVHSYIQSAGGIVIAVAIGLCYIASVGLAVFSSWWLSIWLNAGSGNATIMVDNVTDINDNITDNPRLQFYQLVYGLSAVGFLTITAFRSFVFVKITLRASSDLHKKVFHKVVSSPMSFFDTTPLGRILNRFSKDLDELDITLPFIISPFINNMLLILFSLLTVTFVFPYLLVALVFVFALFFILNFFFRHGIREIKKFDNLARSPWLSHIMTTVQSLPTIHAYRKQQEFIQRFHLQLDDSTNMLILFYMANRWLAIRFDCITIVLTGMTALLAVLTHGFIPAATAGLAITYANQLIGISQYTVRLAAETNARFTSVERINYYIKNLGQEAQQSITSTKPGPTWPSEGRITVKNLKMRYRQHLPLVLKGISFEIKPREKVGIVGRTGSGKSSLGVALYRLAEKAYGSILIDNIDISQIGLYDLRSKLSIIPQDPVLFIGTIRYNLDPTNQFTDVEVWRALEKTYMKEIISGLDQQLQAPVIENGENFSVGERQLICMARALLRNSKILILDEATAAIDTETDSLVQQTIREAFTDCTILTIAHRLNTILDSDRILVLSNGKVVENDSPSVLLADPTSYFTALMSTMEDKTHS